MCLHACDHVDTYPTPQGGEEKKWPFWITNRYTVNDVLDRKDKGIISA